MLLIQAVVALFGFTIDLGEIGGKLIAVIDAAFVLLVYLGISVDPTTAGIADSQQAMTYEQPHDDMAGLK
jgi:phi LC3 family holin